MSCMAWHSLVLWQPRTRSCASLALEVLFHCTLACALRRARAVLNTNARIFLSMQRCLLADYCCVNVSMAQTKVIALSFNLGVLHEYLPNICALTQLRKSPPLQCLLHIFELLAFGSCLQFPCFSCWVRTETDITF